MRRPVMTTECCEHCPDTIHGHHLTACQECVRHEMERLTARADLAQSATQAALAWQSRALAAEATISAVRALAQDPHRRVRGSLVTTSNLVGHPKSCRHSRDQTMSDGFDPPGPDTPGRWRCLLCRPPRWRRGTLRQAHNHYTDVHQTLQGAHAG